MSEQKPATPGPVTPSGLNHLVLNVRDLEESHRFWTEIVGFKQVGELKATPQRPNPAKMRFYSGDHDGNMNHHDIALIERPALWDEPVNTASLMDHVAIALADRDSWLRQLEFLRSRDIVFTARFRRGVSESVHITDPNGHDIEIMYEMPREAWAGDIETALNTGEHVATEPVEA